ncbi:MAG: hypothetical protein Q8S00_05540 [Deltaproteobacteria bacterium]|nr:hypothetical protein [Deltaproteobacteria bacterium]MDZ4341768.1 hypothetical protein [Candidatus Binatia bacterium]
MDDSCNYAGHQFHIPVMGTGFTIDTPLRVARFGISSVISLVDDVLIEKVRRYHASREGEPREAIKNGHPDPRAARITAYLNLVGRLVERQVEALKSAPFEPGSEIQRFFELLPDTPLRKLYLEMQSASVLSERERLQALLRDCVQPGSIDVNIMTKLDCARYRDGVQLPPEFNDAMAALRGYAQSDLRSAIVFSAGLNQRLYNYMGEFPDFFPGTDGKLKKRIILKVSDYRSAAIQGRFLAKRGLWVSEFRIESGLNCGGHAFASGGQLLGPILEEFKQKREELAQSLWNTCVEAWKAKKVRIPDARLAMRVTVQGGVGTAAEHSMLMSHYGVDATGWATPFLLAPDVTAVDDDLLGQLLDCQPEDVYLSDSSPIGIPFWNFRDSPSEEARRKRAADGSPGSACPKGYLRFAVTSSGTPLCMASQDYQNQQLAVLKEQSPRLTEAQVEKVIGKSCICHELGGSALRKYGLNSSVTPAICPSPSLIWFRRRTNLDEMVSHIYGRQSLIDEDARPHMFVQELSVNIDYMRQWIAPTLNNGDQNARKNFREFAQTILAGIQYYGERIVDFAPRNPERFLEAIKSLEIEVHRVLAQAVPHDTASMELS